MEITSFTVSQNRTNLIVVINDAASISSLKLWKQDTYKDYNLAIDLSSKLTASATENITITPSDLNESYFDGVYFLEAEDPDEVSLAVTLDSTRYKECILNRLLEMGVCDECLKSTSINLINAQTLLSGLESAVSLGFIDEIVTIVMALDKYCSSDCKTCGDYKNIISEGYYTLNND